MTGFTRRSSREASPDATDSEFESEVSPAASPCSESTSLPYSPLAAMTSTFPVQLPPISVQDDRSATVKGSKQLASNENPFDFDRRIYYERQQDLRTQSMLLEQQNIRRRLMKLATQETQRNPSHQCGPATSNELSRNEDYQKQLMLLEQQNSRRLRTDLMTQEALKDSNFDTTEPKSKPQEQPTSGAPGWTSNNFQTSRLASLADCARLQCQTQQQQHQQRLAGASTTNIGDPKLLRGQLNGSLYPNYRSNGFHDALRPNIPRANSNCSSSSQHSAPCNAAATNLLESTLLPERVNPLQLYEHRKVQAQEQHRLRYEQYKDDKAAEEALRMQKYYSLPPLSNSEPSMNPGYAQARLPSCTESQYNTSNQYGPYNTVSSGAPCLPSSPPSFSSSNPTSRSVNLPEYVSSYHNEQAIGNVAKRASSDSTHDERTRKKSKPTNDSPLEDITESEVEGSGPRLELPAESNANSEMIEKCKEAPNGQDHVIMDGKSQFSKKIMDKATSYGGGTPTVNQDNELLHTEETLCSEKQKTNVKASSASVAPNNATDDLQARVRRSEIFIMGEDREIEAGNENVDGQASPAHSSSTLDAEDENLNNGPLVDLTISARDCSAQPEQASPRFPKRKKTNFSDTGISVTTTTFKSGKTKTWLRIGREVEVVRAGKQMRREGIEIMTKTIVEGEKVTTTTTTAVIPFLGLDMSDEGFDDEDDDL